MASAQDEGMDFHKAFQSIDTDHSGEITIDELHSYCRKMNYQETFVQKWLTLFDADQNGRITYDEYCNALGLLPKKDVVAKHKSQSKGKKSNKPARTVKVAKRRKQQPEAAKFEADAAQSPAEQEIGEEEVVQAAKVTPVASTEASAPADQGPPPPPPPPAPQRSPRNRNEALNSSGLMCYSRARVFQRKALYRLVKKSAVNKLPRKRPAAKVGDAGGGRAGAAVEKPVGGDKNGGTRMVAARRQPRSLPTEPVSKIPSRSSRRRPTRCFAQHRRRLRESIKPGSVLILLAGRHRGKRVLFLSQLPSGLLLVTGPYKLNGCPLRRVSQSFVIATRTRLELGEIRLPERINDAYFRRNKKKAVAAAAAAAAASQDLFARQSATYELCQERRDDQRTVDAQVMAAICRLDRTEKKLMLNYLSSLFSLKNGQRPHEMVF